MLEIDISIIMPCYNEENVICNVLSRLTDELDQIKYSFEIIFCDNGSTDNSLTVARKFPVRVVNSLSKTVAGVRNEGVAAAKGKMLIFLDADIVVGHGWGEGVSELFQEIISSGVIIGSNPTFSSAVSPILQPWYAAILSDSRNTHLGTGHMMLSSENFKKIGGFDDSLVTGEDYDFCVKAKQLGMSIVIETRLDVCHVGYPSNVLDFAKREMWHGEGDFSNLKSMLKSKVALTSLLFSLLFLLSFIMLFFDFTASLIFIVLALLLAILVQYYKYGFVSFWSSICRSFVSCIYLFSRSVSLPLVILKKTLRF